MIVSNYYRDVTGDSKRNAEMAEVRAGTHPRDDRPHYVLGQFYTLAGRFEDAMREFEECYRLQRRVVPVYAALMRTYARLDLFDKAKGVAKEAFVQKLDGPPIHLELLGVAYRQNDRAAEKTEVQWLTGRPEEYQSLNSQAGYAKMFGQRRKAGELLQRAADVARQWSLPDAAAQLAMPDPLGDAFVGDCEAALKHPAGPPGQVIFAMALCGDTDAARKAADVQSSRAPDNTPWNAVGLPAVRAAIELRSEQPVNAIEALKPAAAYERGQPQIVYLRGLIYLNLHKGAQAAREFRTIVDRKAENWGLYFPLSYVGLARAATLEGDTAKARRAYEDFFALWKDADSDTPILIEARKEYAALKGN
jgi:tetratricopeptide (TPR) repeat protein